MQNTMPLSATHELSQALIEQAHQRLLQLFSDAKTKLMKVYSTRALRHLECPTIAFNQRGKVAASALLQKNLIKLNRCLYVDNQAYFINEVIAHELAHLLVFQIYTRHGQRVKPHGIEWRNMMLNIFEIPANVTHKMDVKKVAMRNFTYACKCQKVELSIVRHNKVVRGKQTYICRKCHATLVWQQ